MRKPHELVVDPERLTKGFKERRTASDLEKTAHQMVKDGTMPSLEQVLGSVAKVREKYGDMIRQAGSGPAESEEHPELPPETDEE